MWVRFPRFPIGKRILKGNDRETRRWGEKEKRVKGREKKNMKRRTSEIADVCF